MSNQKKKAEPTTSNSEPKIEIPKVTAGFSWWGWSLLILGCASSAAITSGAGDFLSVAKFEALKNLNTELGAAIFLAGALSFIGFAVSQYWRFTDARRQFYIISNREQAEANARSQRLRAEADARAERQRAEQSAREYRAKERMLDNYQRQRSAIQNYNLSTYYLNKRLGLSSRDTSVRQLGDALVKLAIGPDRTVESITTADIDRLELFRTYTVSRELEAFSAVVALETPQMSRPTVDKLEKLVLGTDVRTEEESKVLISELLAELTALQVQIASSNPT